MKQHPAQPRPTDPNPLAGNGHSVGTKIVQGLKGFRDALVSGEPFEQRFRTVLWQVNSFDVPTHMG